MSEKLLEKIFSYNFNLKRKRKNKKIHILNEKSNIVNIFDKPDNDNANVIINLHGKNNQVTIKTLKNIQENLVINIYGDDNIVNIGDKLWSKNLYITIGNDGPCQGPCVATQTIIGNDVSIEGLAINTYNSGSKVIIGNNCLFSTGIQLYNTDAHPIYDKSTMKIINKVKTLEIGNHVWIGAYVTILKNVFIGDDNIIGWGSVVSKSFKENNVAIAGNPGKVVKRNITWKINGVPDGYVLNELEDGKVKND